VVWLACEGAVRNTLAKMEEIGGNLTGPRFKIAQKADGDFLFNFCNQADVEGLDAYLGTFNGQCIAVFIDSLRGATQLADEDSKLGKVMIKVNAVVCDRHGAANIWIHHWNKNEQATLLNRSAGSTSITAAVRHVLSVVADSKIKRRIVCAKSNIDDSCPELEAIKIGGQISIRPAPTVSENTLTDQAEIFLADLFSDKAEIYAREIYSAGEPAGLSEDCLKRAKNKLGIGAKRTTTGWVWTWDPSNSAPFAPLHSSHDNYSESFDLQERNQGRNDSARAQERKSANSAKGAKGTNSATDNLDAPLNNYMDLFTNQVRGAREHLEGLIDAQTLEV